MTPNPYSRALVVFAAALGVTSAAFTGDGPARLASAAGSRLAGARTFADSAAEVLQHFADTVRHRYAWSFRGKVQHQVADHLDTRDPIVVRIVWPTYDAASAKAFFRMQVEDNTGRILEPPVDLEVRFKRQPDGLRIAAILPNPTANLTAFTPGASRASSGSTFADSAASALHGFIEAIRQRDIASIRGKLQPAWADQLERGVNSTLDPIAVRLVWLTYDSASAKAFFSLEIVDAAKRDLVPAADLEVTFQRVPGGLRIASVDPRR